MSFEKAGYLENYVGGLPTEREIEKSLKSGRLVEVARLYEKFFDVSIEGEENLKEIPSWKRVIFAPSHITDLDVPISIGALGRFRENIVVTNESAHYKFFENPAANLAMRLAGKKHFRPVHHIGKGGGRVGDFKTFINSDSMTALQEDLKKGKDVIEAAYFDPKYAGNRQELSERAGVGAVYLAQLTGAVIIPVAVNIKMEGKVGMGNFDIFGYLREYIRNNHKKPEVKITICEPIVVGKIVDEEELKSLLDKGKWGGKEGRQERFRAVRERLERESARIMKSIAAVLPKEKRGKWGEELEEQEG